MKMMNIDYIELYPMHGGDSFKVSFKDKISDISTNASSILCENMVGESTRREDLTKVTGIKIDLLLNVDTNNYKKQSAWEQFKAYNYCLIQLRKEHPIDMIAIKGIKFLKENKSKIITTNGREISLYRLCAENKLFKYGEPEPIICTDTFENIEVMQFNDTVCLIKYKENENENERFSYALDYLGSIEVKKLLGLNSR